ncbi:transcriptional regulator [Bizionia sediminis]|uniref:Transcriptional regulator n=1 Tax=Bizionia sediminis TaxID=1737064 RepID=A0ABW5KP91_9FLAO
MIAVITGDIINSKSTQPSLWLPLLRQALLTLEPNQSLWELYRGDSFQIEITLPERSFISAIYLKACLKTLKNLDVRMAIGIGNKSYTGQTVSESNGEAFQFSGETLEGLKKNKISLKLKCPNNQVTTHFNLFFKFASLVMDNWTANSAEVVKIYLENPNAIQQELADMLHISQDAVSKRIKRAHLDELLELNTLFESEINQLKP